MIIFEMPSEAGAPGLRVLFVGSCRLRFPISALADRGDAWLFTQGLSATYTAADALQMVDFVLGDLDIPDGLSPYIFNAEKAPSPEILKKVLNGGVEIFLLEVSTDKQFVYGDICLQENFVMLNLVQAHRGAVLDWYREICLGGVADDACIQIALEKLRQGGFRHDDHM